ncbi:D-beta-hydroxybutyrate dehydrogenase [Pseudomonas caricapapayae]|uniref:D-beta-hydroxybutyrate dehydrogenase n=1 Tax=Pseudomonas caricapapayae TaxID=46678 RepID=A0A0N8QT03_9PSED|nr:SDR family oxidoreductase [Pseudomonas caricapapayae]KAA8697979.1 SDR family oxidoreductase [Pseudomonas caricapapayae]KPW60230.1 D-beta-hydroxybutyrate dehydrogenase [Pseudomonas caricapapayae]RMM09776.1 D-beta-hydroxybutyrate dehydrogenase [Pseudomonas caricapapayae]RMV79530.1 D-beta-hydroxybutyrate dehydrogenase [Pseudomonas caricapapayae]RMV95120.1 D-beta-hydroxybutyrate dehydrogenase [Pseudomonas caricapapayae]
MKAVVLITGAAGGIGQAICAQLIQRGMQLVLADIDEKPLKSLAEKLGEDAHPYVVDLTDQDSLAGLMTYIESAFGRLDVLINNAAIAVVEAFDTRSVESIGRELNINLVAPLILTRLAIPLLKRSTDARIISTVSLGGVFPTPESPIYCASKFGLRGAMLSIGLDLADKGIKVGSILPTATDTQMLRKEAIEGGNALQFIAPPQSPEDVARQVLLMLDKPCLERTPKPSESWASSLAMLFPNLLPRTTRLLQKRGEKGMKKYIESLGERGLAHKVEGIWRLK